MSNPLAQPPEQIAQPLLKRQLPFSSMKPPFSVPADYHRFDPDSRRLTSEQEAEAIIVKPPVSFLTFLHLVLFFPSQEFFFIFFLVLLYIISYFFFPDLLV